MKIVGYLMQYNEATYGNLHRCLENLSAYCDEIVVYDDASTDHSLGIIKQYTDHVIEGKFNDFNQETAHRQQLLELALTLSPDYIFWLDADETLDRGGTESLRAFCESQRLGKYSFEFPEVTLWRSTAWHRTDYLGSGRFMRLWCNTGALSIPIEDGLHKQLYPNGMAGTGLCTHKVLHYGYATKEAIERRWRQRTKLGVPTGFRRKGIDESTMKLEPVPQEWFPRLRPCRYSPDIMSEAGL